MIRGPLVRDYAARRKDPRALRTTWNLDSSMENQFLTLDEVKEPIPYGFSCPDTGCFKGMYYFPLVGGQNVKGDPLVRT